MIIPERKKAVGMILSKFGKKPEMQKMSEGGNIKEVGESPIPDMSAMHAHMQAYMGAMKNEDHEAATEHMMSFLHEHELHAEKNKEDESKDMEPSDKS